MEELIGLNPETVGGAGGLGLVLAGIMWTLKRLIGRVDQHEIDIQKIQVRDAKADERQEAHSDSLKLIQTGQLAMAADIKALLTKGNGS